MKINNKWKRKQNGEKKPVSKRDWKIKNKRKTKI